MTTEIRTLDLETPTDFDLAMAEARAIGEEPSNDFDVAMTHARAAGGPNAIEGFVERMAERVGAKASVRAVFGDPIERDGTTIVPVAKVRWGFGGGAGRGPVAVGPGKPGERSPFSEAFDDGASTDPGAGTGAGGGLTADPVGYLEIGPNGTTFRPIASAMPSPFFVLAAGVTAALVLRAVAKLLRR